MKWDIYKAKAWLLKAGMDHLHGGLFAEGGEMIYEAKWGDACDTEEKFKQLLIDVCCWTDEDIEIAIEELLK